MSTPNHEQRPAIEHQGAVLLKAGAGSGKTFVLVEHLIYRTRQWRQEWESQRPGDFSDWIAQRYAATVLMTFTKLAAGEILVRLTGRFQKEVEASEGSERAWWQEALAQIERLSVTTIDGFFYKLVRKGYFPELPPDLPIIMSAPRRKKIVQLFDAWWEKEAPRADAQASRDSAMHRAALCETLLEIFNDPALRDAWMSFSPSDAAPENLGWLSQELPALEGWQDFLQESVTVPPEARAKNNKWVALADALNSRDKKLSSWEDVLSWAQFASSEVGQTRLVLGSSKELVGDYFEGWRAFRDGVREWAAAFQSYQAHFKDRILPWLKALHQLVRSVNEGLVPHDGLTYGDLEYHVLRSLRDEALARRVRQDFTYFVVDEFQDTSRIQYDTLLLLTGADPKRLFCVGDAKQAIYGFRGGELRVFRDVERTAGITTLPLSANYRSRPAVISFNNAFFRALFPLGREWEGHDPHAVEMEPQTLPASDAQPGRVTLIQARLPDAREALESEREKKKPKWRSGGLHRAEALAITRAISQRLPTLGAGTIAVLYKKLAPAAALMSLLMERGIGFTAQAKIPFKDDPIAGMLLALIDDHLGHKENNWSRFMVTGYLHLLGVDSQPKVDGACGRFGADQRLFGPLIAFDLFLNRLGLTNSLSQNLNEVRELLRLGEGDLEAVAARLRARGSEAWSADFRFGPDSHRVILQTSHGSKGLEYEVVFVAGLATNDRAKPRTDWIGSLPGAALWVEDAGSRQRSPTPQLMFEKALKKQKDFAESKRLFYVACTRAKSELLMVRLVGEGDQLSLGKNSWAEGLEAFLTRHPQGLVEREELELPASEFQLAQSQPPFFHLNPLGISRRVGPHPLPDFGVTSELSVTGLNALLECPRKFYFKHILKLDDEWTQLERSEQAFGGEPAPRALSSSERGSAIHLGLSQAVAQNFVLPLSWVNHPDRAHMEWALQELKANTPPGSQLVSEVPMKFPLFNFMVTGIPDLVIRGTTCEIWDYKTGRRSESSELKYWQQLMMYAWGHWQSGLVSPDATMVLRLCYVDGRELPSKTVSLAEVREALFPLWSALASLESVNLSHCAVCPYSGVCPR